MESWDENFPADFLMRIEYQQLDRVMVLTVGVNAAQLADFSEYVNAALARRARARFLQTVRQVP